ncbi:hypothetical protein D3C81_141670 [compost metagenome]
MLEEILAPSLVLAVIVAVPSDSPVTAPLTTDATVVLLELHITFLFVAFAGATVAYSVFLPPTVTSRLAGVRLTPLTGTSV